MPRRAEDKILSDLAGHKPDQAWRRFLDLYAGRIMAIARQYESTAGKSHDCFLYACEKLSEQGFRRLQQYDETGGALFNTWLTAVVSRLCIDWCRKEYGRRRLPTAILRLSKFDQEVFRLRFVQHLDLGMCMQLVQISCPGKTRDDLAESLSRIHNGLSPQKRWRLEQRGNAAHAGFGRDSASNPLEEAVKDPGLLPDDLANREQEREKLKSALARLSADQQLMLRLRFQEDMTLKDVARIIGAGDLYRARRLIDTAVKELAGLLRHAGNFD